MSSVIFGPSRDVLVTRLEGSKHSLRNQDLHDGADSSTVTLPHAPEPRLTADIPQLQTQRVQLVSTMITVELKDIQLRS